MQFPLTLWDISVLLAVTAIVLLVTSEMLSPYYGKINVRINRKRLRNSALFFAGLFLITVGIRILGFVTT